MKRTKTFAFGAYETKYETKAFGAYEYECEYFKPRKCQGHFGAIWCTFSELKKGSLESETDTIWATGHMSHKHEYFDLKHGQVHMKYVD